MDRMLVVVFDNESKAYEGKKALLQLDNEGSISVYAYAVLAKHADGTLSVKQGDDPGPLGTLLGTALGSFIGLLRGPTGVAIGATAGFAAGSAADIDNARIGDDFIADVTKQLLPNRVAVVAEIEEDWTTPVDTRMEAIGGTLFRRALSEARKTSNEEEIAAMKADLAHEGGACQGPCRTQSKAAREDQPARLQDPNAIAKGQRQTCSRRARGTGQGPDTQGESCGCQSEGVVTRGTSARRSQDLSKGRSRRPPFRRQPTKRNE
jgi:uncharacterized membrane protein